MKIAIIGAGSWGTALGIYLARIGHSVRLWSYNNAETDLINNGRRCIFLPHTVLPDDLFASNDFESVLKDAEIILHVTPSRAVRTVLKEYKKYVKDDQILLMCSKGFESATNKTLDEVVIDELPNVKLGVLSGPSHAEEVCESIPTALVVASEDDSICEKVVDVFRSPALRMYTSHDVKGVELGGALKNIIAFCAGVSVGLGLGDNAFAALVTRGLVEISRLGTAMGGDKDTFYGLTGLGDLIVTCNSEHSRNRTAGKLVGEGKTIEETKARVGMTIESIDNIDVAHRLAKEYNVEMPILNAVYKVLYKNLSPRDAVEALMTRTLKEE